MRNVASALDHICLSSGSGRDSVGARSLGDPLQTQAMHHHCDATWVPSTSRIPRVRCSVIQVGLLFAEHLHTLPGVPVVGTGLVHF